MDNNTPVTIETCYKAQKKLVTNRFFLAAMGGIMTIIGWQFVIIAQMGDRIDTVSGDNNNIETQLSQIQTDLQWIKLELKNR